MIAWDERSHGADWHLELDRALLLPERLVGGRIRVTAEHAIEARGLLITLRAEEHPRQGHRKRRRGGGGDRLGRPALPRDRTVRGASLSIAGTLPPRPLPTIELPHGRTDATFRVTLAKALAADAHLVRDVALATTADL
ncbi:MAG TPA: hypothetical protein VEX41_09860 [Candidatus Eisenbacteria bacterium]|nr:hypothetical protein [Candidatus Eisenbacteria bacterium]